MSEKYEVITYEENAVFNYTLPDKTTTGQVTRELTLVWEDTLEKFLETFGEEKAYEVHSFERKSLQEKFLESIDEATDDAIEQVQEEISQKSKFGFEYTSPTYED